MKKRSKTKVSERGQENFVKSLYARGRGNSISGELSSGEEVRRIFNNSHT